MELLASLRDSTARRSRAAGKLAACVLRDPEAVLSMTTAALAAEVGVSEPTVNRFCTGLGLKGFPDFKLQLAAELARQQPRVAPVIGITAPGSPVAAHCEPVLAVEGGEDTELFTPMTSRLAQLVVIDVLSTRWALLRGDDYANHLARMKQVLADTRYPIGRGSLGRR